MSDKISSPSLINEIDMELMLLVIQNYTSSYSVWSYSQHNKTNYIKPVAYKNINQRFLRLTRLRFLEELQLDDKDKNLRHRIDHKLTLKGLEALIPYIILHPKNIQTIIEYMDKFKMDKMTFGKLLNDRVQQTLNFARSFQRTIKNNPEFSEIYATSKHSLKPKKGK